MDGKGPLSSVKEARGGKGPLSSVKEARGGKEAREKSARVVKEIPILDLSHVC